MTPNPPEIAVVLPVYNPGEALGMTLDSLRQQTVPFRLYLIDDGSSSKPDYHQLLLGFDYRLIELEKNCGIATALNAGLEAALLAGHAFIARMDCGDWCNPERLELSRRFLHARPDVDLMGTWTMITSKNTGLNYLFQPPTDNRSLMRQLYYGMAFIHPAMMIRAKLFQKIGCYSTDYEAAEDYEFCRRAARAGLGLANIPHVLLRKIEDATSISVKKRRLQLWSRLRIQWHYRDGSIHCALGMVRTLLLFLTPRSLLQRAKALVSSRNVGHNDAPIRHPDESRGPA
ncbi:MAG: glycosyltransferase family 2 protein [Aestuariivirgaceae bacterium]